MIKVKRKFKMPSTTVILFLIIVLMAVLTYVVPAGQFEKIVDPETGISYFDAESYHQLEKTPTGFFGIFLSIQKGFIDASSVIFLILFAYFCIYSIVKTGALHFVIGRLIKKIGGKEKYVIPLFMIIFALAGSTYGEMDTVYGLIPIFIGLAIALGYDAIVGLAISGMGVAIGFASATTNPFTIGIAQSIAELPIFSGIIYRWIVFVVFVGVGIWWTMRYAEKIKRNPELSVVKDIDYSSFELNTDELDSEDFNFKHIIVLLLLVVTIGAIVYGSLNLGWYIDEMSAMFLMAGVIISILWGYSANEIAGNFLQACQDMMIGALIVGLSRSILVILRDSNILDTVIYSLYLPLKNMHTWAAAEGMLIIHNLLNFLVPSGSGKAAAVMPIMIPLADMLDINRQVAVLAFQFGDGFSNLLWPTSVAIMIGVAKIPLDRWYKFFVPLFGIMFILQTAMLFIAMAINYGPF